MFKNLRLRFQPSLKAEAPPGLGESASLLFTFDQLTKSWLLNPIKKPYTVTSIPLEALRVLTWNVDFASPDPELRMGALLAHLQLLLGEEPSPIILLLQEVHPAALRSILEHTWIRNSFAVTNTVLARNSLTYGTMTLVAKALVPSVSCCFRVPYKETAFGRDALFVDLRIVMPPSAGSKEQKAKEGKRVLRVGNTHLESLQGRGIAFRQAQLTLINDVLSVPKVYAGLVGGDMNATAVEDMDLVERIGLKDLWMGEGGETWGYQLPCEVSPGRLDKILAVGDVCLVKDTRVERVGVGLKTEQTEGGKESYISDHYGLICNIQVGGSVPW